MRRFHCLPFLAVCAALVLSACHTAAPDKPGSAFVAPQGRRGALVHRDSTFAFPPSVAGFHRTRHVQYDASGQDVSVDYVHDDPRVSAAIFILPRNGQKAAQELDRRVAEVGARHKGARAVASGSLTVTPQHDAATTAEFRYEGPFNGERQTLRSRLVVAEHKEWFVIYRITYAASAREKAEGLANALLNEYDWRSTYDAPVR